MAPQPGVHHQEVKHQLRQSMHTSSLSYCHAKQPIPTAHAVSISIRSLMDVVLLSDVTQITSVAPEVASHCPIHPYEVPIFSIFPAGDGPDYCQRLTANCNWSFVPYLAGRGTTAPMCRGRYPSPGTRPWRTPPCAASLCAPAAGLCFHDTCSGIKLHAKATDTACKDLVRH